MATAWLNLGLCELQANHYEQAVHALSQATRQRPEATLAWLWLGKTYEAMGDKTQAAQARQKAQSINKAMADAFEQGLQSLTNHPNTMLPADAKP